MTQGPGKMFNFNFNSEEKNECNNSEYTMKYKNNK